MSAELPAAGRQAVNVILDAVSAHEGNESLDAMNLALRRLSEVDGAYQVSLSDEDEVSLDLSNLVGGTMVAISRLVQIVADEKSVSREEVISDLREWLG